MNCKPGDLAFVVKSHYKNEGKIVRCIRVLSKSEAERQWWFSSDTDPLWLIDVPLASTSGRLGRQRVEFVPYCNDSRLRPLDNPPDSAADLLLAPLPKQEKVPA